MKGALHRAGTRSVRMNHTRTEASIAQQQEAFKAAHVTQEWHGDLRNTWGATSLHAVVFRRPRGFRWVHCAKCYAPSTPSGNRSLVLPAKGVAEMEVVCKMAQAAARGETTPLFAVHQ